MATTNPSGPFIKTEATCSSLHFVVHNQRYEERIHHWTHCLKNIRGPKNPRLLLQAEIKDALTTVPVSADLSLHLADCPHVSVGVINRFNSNESVVWSLMQIPEYQVKSQERLRGLIEVIKFSITESDYEKYWHTNYKWRSVLKNIESMYCKDRFELNCLVAQYHCVTNTFESGLTNFYPLL